MKRTLGSLLLLAALATPQANCQEAEGYSRRSQTQDLLSFTCGGYGKVRGSVTQSELLILPGSELWDLCGDFHRKEGPKPYWRVDLGLPLLFGSERWRDEGLTGPALQNPTAKLLQICDEKFQALVEAEEKKPHGQLRGVDRYDG